MEGVMQAASVPATNGNGSGDGSGNDSSNGSINASILGHVHESRMQLPETSGEKSIARHKVTNEVHRRAPFPRLTLPEGAQSTTA